MESDLVDKLDEAWRRQGLKSRMELFRISLQKYFASVGEDALAEKLGS
jgi:metal-responsive CopG/Arc/MetJ family transcriptional regulator